MSAAKPTKTPFAFFACPKCKHQSKHAWFLTKKFQTYAWCERCSSYFLQRNGALFGLLWGGGFAPLIILLVMEGPLAPWLHDFGRAGLMAIAGVIAYVGRNAP